MIFKIYDTARVIKGKTLYDITIYANGELVGNYYNLTALGYSTVMGAFKLLEKHKYKEEV